MSSNTLDELTGLVIAVLVLLLSQVLQELRAKKRHTRTIDTITKTNAEKGDTNDA